MQIEPKHSEKKFQSMEYSRVKLLIFYNELFNDIAKAKEIDPFSEDFFLWSMDILLEIFL